MSHSSKVAALARDLGNPNVRSVDATRGQGYGTGAAPSSTGGDSATGNGAGAPYRSRQMRDDGDTVTRAGMKNNPYNANDTDEKGVLGANIMAKEAPPIDSPVPRGQHMPDRFGNYKADAVDSVTKGTPAGQPVTFPDGGVLGRS